MICFPQQVPFNPLRLASNFRDFWGDQHALFTAMTDPLVDKACYIPRIYHAPDTEDENAGVAANGYLEYALTLPPGAFILGFLHAYCGGASANATDAPVTAGFKFQITDVQRAYRWFAKPLPETWLLQDQPSYNPQAVVGNAPLTVLNPSPRLLAAPYPVAPRGVFKIEFWNCLVNGSNAPIANTGIRLSVLAAVPDTIPANTLG